jgi:hypothetical protein
VAKLWRNVGGVTRFLMPATLRRSGHPEHAQRRAGRPRSFGLGIRRRSERGRRCRGSIQGWRSRLRHRRHDTKWLLGGDASRRAMVSRPRVVRKADGRSTRGLLTVFSVAGRMGGGVRLTARIGQLMSIVTETERVANLQNFYLKSRAQFFDGSESRSFGAPRINLRRKIRALPCFRTIEGGVPRSSTG